MKAQLEALAKNQRKLAVAIVLLAAFGLVFVVPKIFISLEPGGKKMFWLSFAVSLGVMMTLLFPQKKEKASSKKQEKLAGSSLSHQQLLDKVGLCLWELKKQQIWAYTCLVLGWLVVWVGRWSGHPHYSHYIFSIPVFVFTFLAATKSWEKVHDLDVDVAKYTLDGIILEKKKANQQSDRFRAFASSYDGLGMWKFAFIRISPALMIIFSLLNAGILPLLVHHFGLPRMMVNVINGFVIASLFIFFSKVTCRSYYWMLNKMKEVV